VIDESQIARAVAALRAGGLVVLPTETLYAIGCDALQPAAVAKLCAAKQREAEKGIAVIVSETAMLEQITREPSPQAKALIAAFWPGPLTLLFPARGGISPALVVDGRIGARVSSHPIATRLAHDLGHPIAVPSANPANLPPANDVAAASAYFGDGVAVYLDDGPIARAASTVVDPGPPLKILREGAVASTAIMQVVED
jgi:tRNA threonylcarbamoyl adenosine modification protein (Sua5/YciO/YrdC/YwlC family)